MSQTPPRDRATHAFLIKVGMVLHQFGTPSHRLERVMTELAEHLGIQGTFLYTPTALIMSISAGEDEEATYLRRADSGALDVDKLIKFDETLERFVASELSIEQASEEIDRISQAAAPYPSYVAIMACAISSAAVAILFRGTWPEVACASFVGLIVCIIEWLHGRWRLERGFLEPITGFVASILALLFARYIFPIDDRLVTLAGLIILIPGLGITVALTELAVGHLSAGVARLAGACVSLLTITIGVALGWRVAAESLRNIPAERLWLIDPIWTWVAMVVAPVTFAIVFRARPPQWPVIIAVTMLGFLSSRFAGDQWGTEVGAFCGAFAVGLASNMYARVRNRPALVPFTPGLIILVPGSVGFRSLTAMLDHETIAGVDFAFTMVILAAALVGGILSANAVLPPKRIL